MEDPKILSFRAISHSICNIELNVRFDYYVMRNQILCLQVILFLNNCKINEYCAKYYAAMSRDLPSVLLLEFFFGGGGGGGGCRRLKTYCVILARNADLIQGIIY